jgi:hypothetical protein
VSAGSGRSVACGQLTAPSAALIVAMIAPPRVTEMNELRKPAPKNRRRIQASARSSNAIAASASSTADRGRQPGEERVARLVRGERDGEDRGECRQRTVEQARHRRLRPLEQE